MTRLLSNRLFCWRSNFKIRSKADAERLLNMVEDPDFNKFDGELYFHDDSYDYCISAKRKSVSFRPIFERGNIFSPYFDNGGGYVDMLWKLRKYINAQIFGDGEW